MQIICFPIRSFFQSIFVFHAVLGFLVVFLILCIYGVGCNEAMLQHLRWPTRRVVVIFALVVLLGYLLVYTGLRLGLESETQDWSFKSDNSFQYRNAILVTGGLGRVGLALVRWLLRGTDASVIVVDAQPQGQLRHAIAVEFPSSHARLRIHEGDVRDEKLMKRVVAELTSLRGVVHLASLSNPTWCSDHEELCFDINVRGTRTVLQAIQSAANVTSGAGPWQILVSSVDVGRLQINNGTVDMEPEDLVLARTKFASERVFEENINAVSGGNMSRARIVRLSNVYGESRFSGDHGSLVDALVKRAMINLALEQYVSEERDYLHISDAVAAVMQIVDQFTQQQDRGDEESMIIYRVSSGERVDMKQLVDKIVDVTNSLSPIRKLDSKGPKKSSRRSSLENSPASRSLVKDFAFAKRPITLDQGLRMATTNYLQEALTYLRNTKSEVCSQDRWGVNDLVDLDSCDVSISANNRHLFMDGNSNFPFYGGDLVGVKCGERWELHMLTVYSFVSPVIKFRARQDQGPATKSKGPKNNRRLVAFGCGEMGTGLGGFNASDVKVSKISEWEGVNHTMLEWEAQVQEHTGMVKLFVPGTDRELVPGKRKDLVLQDNEPDVWNFRVTPICCSHSNTWTKSMFELFPLFPNYQYFARNQTRPVFNVTMKEKKCEFIQAAERWTERRLTTTSKAGNYSREFSEWANRHLQVCMNDCNHPLICIDTGNCRCTYEETCSFDSNPRYLDRIVHQHEKLNNQSDWPGALRSVEQVFFPRMRRILSMIDFPTVHVTTPAFNWSDVPARHKGFVGGACYIEDYLMILPLTSLGWNISARDADLILVPYVHGWVVNWQPPERYTLLGDWVLQTINTTEYYDPDKVIIIFVHDRGACNGPTRGVWEAASWGWDKRYWAIEKGIALQAMSDYNTECYWPERDVVIPSTTCVHPKLWQVVTQVTNTTLKRSGERSILVMFGGSIWGGGAMVRRSLMCDRNFPGPLKTMWGWEFEDHGYKDYIDALLDARFCPLPGGTTGWTSRFVDVIVAGCIPVLLSDRSHYPFSEILDFSKFSIRIPETQVYHLESILLSIDEERLEDMQRNLLAIRHVFLYPPTPPAVPEEELARNGPLHFIMLIARLRTLTHFPRALSSDALEDD